MPAPKSVVDAAARPASRQASPEQDAVAVLTPTTMPATLALAVTMSPKFASVAVGRIPMLASTRLVPSTVAAAPRHKSSLQVAVLRPTSTPATLTTAVARLLRARSVPVGRTPMLASMRLVPSAVAAAPRQIASEQVAVLRPTSTPATLTLALAMLPKPSEVPVGRSPTLTPTRLVPSADAAAPKQSASEHVAVLIPTPAPATPLISTLAATLAMLDRLIEPSVGRAPTPTLTTVLPARPTAAERHRASVQVVVPGALVTVGAAVTGAAVMAGVEARTEEMAESAEDWMADAAEVAEESRLLSELASEPVAVERADEREETSEATALFAPAREERMAPAWVWRELLADTDEVTAESRLLKELASEPVAVARTEEMDEISEEAILLTAAATDEDAADAAD